MSSAFTFEELKAKTHAYDAFFTIDNSMLPAYYRTLFNEKCRCGAEIIISADNTQPQCCNPSCWVKYAYRFAYFCQSLGYKGIGPKTALTIFGRMHKMMKYDTFLAVFYFDPRDMTTCVGCTTNEIVRAIKDDLQKRPVSFSDAINALGINGIGLRSSLFDSVGDIITLVKVMLEGRVDEMCDTAGIQAEQTRFALKEAKVDILALAKDIIPHIVATPSSTVYIMITGSVSVDGQRYAREDFIELCAALTDQNGRPAYNLIQTKSRSLVQYAIADAPSTSSKYVLGKELGILTTAQQFYDMLKSKLEVQKHE